MQLIGKWERGNKAGKFTVNLGTKPKGKEGEDESLREINGTMGPDNVLRLKEPEKDPSGMREVKANTHVISAFNPVLHFALENPLLYPPFASYSGDHA